MLKSRGAAVIGAFVLIALAIFIRGLVVGDDGGSDGHKKGDDGSTPVVACTPELVEVCDALADDGQIAADPPTLDLDDAAAPPTEVDGWITWNPAPAIANFDAGQVPVWDESDALGSARLAALLDPATEDVLRGCDGDSVWVCVARSPSDGLTIGVGEPSTAEGLSRLAPLAEALAPDLDPEALPSSDLRAIVASSDSQTDAATMSGYATQPGRISIVVGPEDLLGAIASTNQGVERELQVAVATPEAKATVVVAPRVGRDLDLADACEDDAVADALRSVGVVPCRGKASDELAGFLYNVREKAS